MDVREFVGRLGLEVDSSAFALGDKVLGALKNGLFSIGGAASAAAGALAASVGLMTAEGGRLDDMSKQLDVNVESLQSLAYAAKFSGLSIEDVGSSLNFLGKSAFAASQGATAQADAFKKLGISVKGSDGRLKGSDELFREMAGGLANVQDGGERTALAMATLGRGGARMLALLNGGPEELARLETRAKLLGVVMDKDTVAAADALGDSVDDLLMAFKGLRNMLGGPLLESVRTIVDSMTEWFVENHAALKAGFDKWLGRLGVLLRGVARVLIPIVKGALWLGETVWGVVAAFAAFWAIAKIGTMGQAFVGWVYKAVTAFRSLTTAQLTAQLSALAWGLALIAAALILEDIYVGLHGGKSLTLGLMRDWTTFLDDFTKAKVEDGPLLRELKRILAVIFDIQGAWLELKKEFTGGTTAQNAAIGDRTQAAASAAAKKGKALNVTQGPSAGLPKSLSEFIQSLPTFGPSLSFADPFSQEMESWFGGGASPGASVKAQSKVPGLGAAPVKVLAPNVTNNISVNPPPGTSANDVADITLKKAHSAVDTAARDIDEANP